MPNVADDERVQTPVTIKNFARAVGVHLPQRLGELRRLGKGMRALGRGQAKK